MTTVKFTGPQEHLTLSEDTVAYITPNYGSPELDAMGLMAGVLDGFDGPTCARVLAYLTDRFVTHPPGPLGDEPF